MKGKTLAVLVALVASFGVALAAILYSVTDVSPSPGVVVTGSGSGPYLVNATGAIGSASVATIIDVAPPAPGTIPGADPPVVQITFSEPAEIRSVEFFAPGGEFDEYKPLDYLVSPGTVSLSYLATQVPGFDPTVPYQIILDLRFGNGSAGGSGDLSVPGGPGGGTASGSTSVQFGLVESVTAPEPGTWSYVLLGFVLGYVLARRARSRTR